MADMQPWPIILPWVAIANMLAPCFHVQQTEQHDRPISVMFVSNIHSPFSSGLVSTNCWWAGGAQRMYQSKLLETLTPKQTWNVTENQSWELKEAKNLCQSQSQLIY